jgi:hypothetical protein
MKSCRKSAANNIKENNIYLRLSLLKAVSPKEKRCTKSRGSHGKCATVGNHKNRNGSYKNHFTRERQAAHNIEETYTIHISKLMHFNLFKATTSFDNVLTLSTLCNAIWKYIQLYGTPDEAFTVFPTPRNATRSQQETDWLLKTCSWFSSDPPANFPKSDITYSSSNQFHKRKMTSVVGSCGALQ